jgi:hypothetical protein
MRGRPRAVFARYPRSRSRTAEGGGDFRKNAKSLKSLRSPRCKSRSTLEHANDRHNKFRQGRSTSMGRCPFTTPNKTTWKDHTP